MAPVQRALAEQNADGVRLVFARDVSKHRLDMGWQRPDYGKGEVVVLNGNSAQNLARESRGLNIFGGISDPVLRVAYRSLPRQDTVRRVILAEAGNPIGIKGFLRSFYHRFEVMRHWRKADFLLGFGEQGAEYYKRCGFDADRVFPFMYQVESTPVIVDEEVGTPVRLIYVGGFSKRKGVDILLDAMAMVSSLPWKLTIVGGGTNVEEEMLKRRSRDLGIDSRVTWVGVLASDRILQTMADHDICLVPSRFDGWGMATNEAIEAGIAVVSMPRIGSRDLVLATHAGRVATETSASAFAKTLRSFLEKPNEIHAAKAAARSSRPEFRGENVADYLLSILNSVINENKGTPIPPWQRPRVVRPMSVKTKTLS